MTTPKTRSRSYPVCGEVSSVDLCVEIGAVLFVRFVSDYQDYYISILCMDYKFGL